MIKTILKILPITGALVAIIMVNNPISIKAFENPDYVGPSTNVNYTNKESILATSQLNRLPGFTPPSATAFKLEEMTRNTDGRDYLATSAGVLVSVNVGNYSLGFIPIPIVAKITGETLVYDSNVNITDIEINNNNLYITKKVTDSDDDDIVAVEYTNISQIFTQIQEIIISSGDANDKKMDLIKLMTDNEYILKESGFPTENPPKAVYRIAFDKHINNAYIATDNGVYFEVNPGFLGQKLTDDSTNDFVTKLTLYNNDGSVLFDDTNANSVAIDQYNDLYIGCENGLIIDSVNYNRGNGVAPKYNNQFTGDPNTREDNNYFFSFTEDNTSITNNLHTIVAPSDPGTTQNNISDISFPTDTSSYFCSFSIINSVISNGSGSTNLKAGISIKMLNNNNGNKQIGGATFPYDFLPNIFFPGTNGLPGGIPDSAFSYPILPEEYFYSKYSDSTTLNVITNERLNSIIINATAYGAVVQPYSSDLNRSLTNYQLYNQYTNPQSFDPVKDNGQIPEHSLITFVRGINNAIFLGQNDGISSAYIQIIPSSNNKRIFLISVVVGSITGGIVIFIMSNSVIRYYKRSRINQ